MKLPKHFGGGGFSGMMQQMQDAHAEIHQHHKMLGQHHTQDTDAEDSRDAAVDASQGEVDTAY